MSDLLEKFNISFVSVGQMMQKVLIFVSEECLLLICWRSLSETDQLVYL